MSLGAFMAGVLLSESEYRHELEADIAPFEGLLLGFFFISVGMSADLGLARRRVRAARWVATGGLLVAKIVICFILARLRGQSLGELVRFSLALPQASEFSFVLFGAAVAVGALDARQRGHGDAGGGGFDAATPMLFALSEAWSIPLAAAAAPPPAYDQDRDRGNPVIVSGFGRVGQIIGRVLRMHGIAFTALERDPGQVDVMRRFGGQVYFGDPTRRRPAARRGRRAGEAARRCDGPHGGRAALGRRRQAPLPRVEDHCARAKSAARLLANGPGRGGRRARHISFEPEDGRGISYGAGCFV